MRLLQIHWNRCPASRLIERALAPADERMRAGLYIEIGLRPHRFNDVDDGRETDAGGLSSVA